MHTSALSKNGRHLVAFLPIRPIYANRILSGDKRFEFRRAPINGALTHIVIYASTPTKKIVGLAEVAKVGASSPTAAWESSKHAAGISRKDFRRYFESKKRAYTIKLRNVIQFDRPVHLDEVSLGFKVPQSFRYVQPGFVKTLLRASTRP